MNTISAFKKGVLLAAFFVFGLVFAQAQKKDQKQLEAERAKIQEDIKKINQLLLSEKQQKGNVMEQMEAIDQKISSQQRLLRLTKQQSNLINRRINSNIREVSRLRQDLANLKEDYAGMIHKSYQNRGEQNRLMFVLSSVNFKQAYKRWQYMKQYTKYRKQQGEDIKEKTKRLAEVNDDLIVQRRNKDRLIVENEEAKKSLTVDLKSQQDLLKTIKSNESRYGQALAKRRREARQIEAEINRLIKLEIARANKESGNSNSSRFVLTPEAKTLANNFQSSKGKLIWPVEKGIKSTGFGVYYDKVYPTLKHNSSGVIISTAKGQQARAIYDGEVMSIATSKLGKKWVYIRHGNFISCYYNLSKVYVEKGDKVAAKTILGDIFTDSQGRTKLKFYLFKDDVKLNPENWIYQL